MIRILTTYGDENTKKENKKMRYLLKCNCLEENSNTIIALIDRGCLDGTRRSCYKVINGLDNVFNLFSALNGEWYLDDTDVVSVQTYSNGINYIKFREVKDEEQIKEICGLQLENELTKEKIDKMTMSIKEKVIKWIEER